MLKKKEQIKHGEAGTVSQKQADRAMGNHVLHAGDPGGGVIQA